MKHKIHLFSFILLFSSAPITHADPIGIDVYNETHHVTVSNFFEIVTETSEAYHSDPISIGTQYNIQGYDLSFVDDLGDPSSYNALATSGDFSVNTAAAGRGSAVAESIYHFTVDATRLSLHISGFGESGELPDDSQSSVKVFDVTSNKQIFFVHKQYNPPCGGCPDDGIGGSAYDFDETYHLRVNPNHKYTLTLYSFSNGYHGGPMISSLQAEIALVPVPPGIRPLHRVSPPSVMPFAKE